MLLAAAVTALFLVLRPEPPRLVASAPAGSDAEHLVAILQYLESDYPSAVTSGDQNELAEQRSLSSEAVALARRLRVDEGIAARLTAVDERVNRAVEAHQVSADCASIVDDLVATSHVARAPTTPPDLERGAHLFALACAPCHGATGYGDGPAAIGLNPKPASFHSYEVMSSLTPFKAQGVIRFGVKGTAMVPFDGFEEKDRWALAFYIFTLRRPPCDHIAIPMRLEELANSTDAELGARAGEKDVT